MPEFDTIVQQLSVSQESKFRVKELFNLMKEWFNLHQYDFYERDYKDVLEETGKNIYIKWETERKVDDYTRFHIEVRIEFKNLIEEKGKKDIVNKGSIRIRFKSFLEKDYEGNWEKNFFMLFLRAVYNKFIAKSKFDEYGAELKEETFDIYNQVRAFLKIHKV